MSHRPSRGLRQRVIPASMAVALGALLLVGGPATASRVPVDDVRPAVAAAVARVSTPTRASGLTKPLFVTSARDGTGRLFVLEQTGRIKIYKDGAIRSTPYLSLAGKVGTAFEQGLLGLAFHPGFKTNRKLYVSYTDLNLNVVVREYKQSLSSPNTVATSTARTIITIGKPYNNHNGGMLAFGRDGYLYISAGDGGGIGDPGNRAQNTSSLLGKILRIDVNGTTASTNYRNPSSNPYVGVPGLNEIWQIGLRNTWRFSFDRLNGDMWLGDVGQALWEEVDVARRTTSGPGKGINWGWKVLEGTHCYKATTCDTSGKTMPISEYEHLDGRCSIIGGYVYRGTAIPALVGHYVFGDFCTGEIFTIPANASAMTAPNLLIDTGFTLTSFGENASGELYLTSRGGSMAAIVPN